DADVIHPAANSAVTLEYVSHPCLGRIGAAHMHFGELRLLTSTARRLLWLRAAAKFGRCPSHEETFTNSPANTTSATSHKNDLIAVVDCQSHSVLLSLPRAYARLPNKC